MHKHTHNTSKKSINAERKIVVLRNNKSKRRNSENKQSQHVKLRDLVGVIPTWNRATIKPDMGIDFKWSILATSSGASNILIRRYNPNSIWQPEAGGSTGVVPAYSEWAAFFGFYRVVGYEYTVTVTNKEAFDVQTYIINSNNDPGTTAPATLTSNPLCKWKMISAKGGLDKVSYSHKYNLEQILGTDTCYTADSYRSLIGASPADIVWLGIGAQSLTGANLTNGVDIALTIVMRTVMYDRLLLTAAERAHIQQHRLKLIQAQLRQPEPELPVVIQPI
jgi:hypothetical protein